MADTGRIDAYIRAARPRALAALTRYFGDFDFAEEAFQEACLRAVRTWSADGIARDPTAWLIIAGRNAGIDLKRSKQNRPTELLTDNIPDTDADIEDEVVEQLDSHVYRDDVLRLLFMCCHPDLKPGDQLALALKIVVGFSVEEIARAFIVRPKAMEQRITRAKKKAAVIANALETPSPKERTARLSAVIAMIYLLFNEGYSADHGETHIRISLCEEAIRLARLLLRLFQGQAEVMGLLALCLLHHSRYKARIGDDEMLVPLNEQDRDLWQRELINEGCVLIEKALRKGTPGPYQIQAAIAAVHCTASTEEETDWHEIERLYAALQVIQPSPIIALNKAVAVSKTTGAQAALDLVEPLSNQLQNYLHYHTTLAALLIELNQPEDAKQAYQKALSLGPTEAEARYIKSKMASFDKKTLH